MAPNQFAQDPTELRLAASRLRDVAEEVPSPGRPFPGACYPEQVAALMEVEADLLEGVDIGAN
jgi:hypothetical protein